MTETRAAQLLGGFVLSEWLVLAGAAVQRPMGERLASVGRRLNSVGLPLPSHGNPMMRGALGVPTMSPLLQAWAVSSYATLS